jgi:predicted glycosyltransferase
LRSNLIVSALFDFAPDLILVDKKPLGVSNELLPAFNALARRANPPRAVLLIRDILDTPEVTAKVWNKNGYHNAVQHFYDRILIVGSRDIFDVGEQYRFPAATAAKLRYCGYIARERGLRPRQEVLRELDTDGRPLVLVTVGGGEDGYQLLMNYTEGLRASGDRPAFHSLLLVGPEMSPSQRSRIAAAAASLPHIGVREFTNDIMSFMEAAELVVSMGGYNTVCELLTLRKRAIVVPRMYPVREQLIRARCMAERGLLRYLDPRELSPSTLMTAVWEELGLMNCAPAKLYRVELNALDRVRDELLTMLSEPVAWDDDVMLAGEAGW